MCSPDLVAHELTRGMRPRVVTRPLIDQLVPATRDTRLPVLVPVRTRLDGAVGLLYVAVRAGRPVDQRALLAMQDLGDAIGVLLQDPGELAVAADARAAFLATWSGRQRLSV